MTNQLLPLSATQCRSSKGVNLLSWLCAQRRVQKEKKNEAISLSIHIRHHIHKHTEMNSYVSLTEESTWSRDVVMILVGFLIVLEVFFVVLKTNVEMLLDFWVSIWKPDPVHSVWVSAEWIRQHDWDGSSHPVCRQWSIQFAHLLKLSAPCHSSSGSGNEAPVWVTGMMDTPVTDSDRARLIAGQEREASHQSLSRSPAPPPRPPLDNNTGSSNSLISIFFFFKENVNREGGCCLNPSAFFLPKLTDDLINFLNKLWRTDL